MIQFVQPIWLWTVTGISVPLFIHLWNIRQGKTIKVGSIAFLSESARAHSRSLRLSELWLLLLRCLLLIILAGILSKPFLEKQQGAGKGWIVIEKQDVQPAYAKFRPLIDSLLQQGYGFHYLSDGFPEEKLPQAITVQYDSAKSNTISYWTLLKELNQQVPASMPVYLFTTNRTNRFTGNRPKVSLDLKWHVFSSEDTATTWTRNAYKMYNDSIRVITGHSSSTGTYHTYRTVQQLAADEQVTVDTTTMVICIYADKTGSGANYLKAALEAAKEVTKRRLRVTVVSDAANIPAQYDWLFWLSPNTIPATLKKNKLFLYAAGKEKPVYSYLVTMDETIHSSVKMYKLIDAQPAKDGYAIWQDGYGNPVLSRKNASPAVYHFYSRFDPQWNGLVWSETFPRLVYNLVFDELSDETVSGRSLVILDEKQVMPVITDESELLPKQALQQRMDLAKPLWLLAFVLFLLERIVTHQKKKEEANA